MVWLLFKSTHRNGLDDARHLIVDVKTEKTRRNEPGNVFQAILHCLSIIQTATY